MKKIVPFTKDLMFKTKISEITTITLDNSLKLDGSGVTGEFIIEGSYKLIEGSTTDIDFKYNLPVDITIDSKYDTINCKISIDDFYYEIINEEKLRVNISVMLDDLDIKEDPIETMEVIINDIDNNNNDRENIELNNDQTLLNNINNIDYNNIEPFSNKEKVIDNSSQLFESQDNNIEYSIYRVYTMKEDDTLSLIYEKFNTTKEILNEYNDLDNITTGSKIIIPSQDE